MTAYVSVIITWNMISGVANELVSEPSLALSSPSLSSSNEASSLGDSSSTELLGLKFRNLKYVDV